MSPTESRDPDNILAEVDRRVDPPPELEDRVVAALRREGLVRRSSGRGHRWTLAAACVICLLLGWALRGWMTVSSPSPGGEEYLLLLSEPRPLTTTRSLPELAGEYRAWAQELGAEGRMVAAARLEPGERRLGRPEEEEGAGGSHRAPATGFFVIRAGSWEEALEVAGSCPHLAYGGEIAVRPVAGSSAAP